MRHFLPVAALAASLALPVQAEPQRWAVLGEWDVGWYPDLRGCLAFTQFETTAFFIGFDTAGPTRALDITVLDDRWTSIEPEQVYPVTLNFGRKDPWVLDMHGVHMDGAPGLHILVDAALPRAEVFIEEFQREMRMTWAYAGAELGRFTLRGSRRAFDAVEACQTSHRERLANVD